MAPKQEIVVLKSKMRIHPNFVLGLNAKVVLVVYKSEVVFTAKQGRSIVAAPLAASGLTALTARDHLIQTGVGAIDVPDDILDLAIKLAQSPNNPCA